MTRITCEDRELSVGERNYFSIAYENLVSPRLSSWKATKANETEEESHEIKMEISKICEDVLKNLDEHLIPNTKTATSQVFFYKMWVTSPPCSSLSTHTVLIGRETTTNI